MEFVSGSNNDSKAAGKDELAIDSKIKAAVQIPPEDNFCGECIDDLPPPDRLVIPADVVEIGKDDESIVIIGTRGTKVTKIAGLEGMNNLKVSNFTTFAMWVLIFIFLQELVLRSCLVSEMEGMGDLVSLQKLELYDNQIESIDGVQNLSMLRILDLSFNAIRVIPSLADSCPFLEELYIAQNKLRRIQGLEDLTELKILDLGANRIRVLFLILLGKDGRYHKSLLFSDNRRTRDESKITIFMVRKKQDRRNQWITTLN